MLRRLRLQRQRDKELQPIQRLLDDQSHTIKGQASLLFYTINGGTVKNLVIDSANITSGGAIATTLSGNGLIENITVNANHKTLI
ncbi:MAG: hypothetical protein PUA78_09255 [Porphyromonadaceae bacterium]|nr:hypothetical protein [Porphyromonadaceae bacterium]